MCLNEIHQQLPFLFGAIIGGLILGSRSIVIGSVVIVGSLGARIGLCLGDVPPKHWWPTFRVIDLLGIDCFK